MKIAVFGLGYVGLTAAACLTKSGHDVVGFDVSEQKIAAVNAGKSPITEPGLEDLIATAAAEGRLKCFSAIEDRLADCDMAIVCVGTPSAPDGSHNMSYIAEVSRQIATAVNADRADPLTVVYRSTIRPGTVEDLVFPIFRRLLGEKVGAIELVYNPEFLRESSAIKDYFAPPKIVIGTHDGLPSKNMDLVNAGIEAPVFYTRFREAEFTKFVDNTFHALKVAFANEIGRVCSRLNISAAKVHEIFISDTKLNISPYYLRPGGAFGGSCLPKDVRALQYIAGDVGASAHVVDSLIRSNEAHKHFLFEMCAADLPADAKVLMLGVSFKKNSDDLRESPNIDLARKFLGAGFQFSIYDPAVEPKNLVGQNLGYSFQHLPDLEDLLVSQATAESTAYDLVIDTSARSVGLKLDAKKIIDIGALA
jgi:GDP-mannose 6-dehydrogenase